MRSCRVGISAITVTTGTALAVVTGMLLAACGEGAPTEIPSTPATGAPAQPDPRGMLAARVAVALVVAAFATQLAPRLIDLGTPVFVSIGLVIFILGIGWLVLLMRNK